MIYVLDYERRLARLNTHLADLAVEVEAVCRENERLRANLARSGFRVVGEAYLPDGDSPQ